jgi:VIT1/CCC1 family predicted Fe2+/Mn2+ transporter
MSLMSFADKQYIKSEVAIFPEVEREEIYEITGRYNISREATKPLVDELCRSADHWVRFMMDFELKLDKPNVSRAWISAATMGLSYFLGGLVPMIPYFAMNEATDALFVCIGITVVILLAFGYTKSWITLKSKRSPPGADCGQEYRGDVTVCLEYMCRRRILARCLRKFSS